MGRAPEFDLARLTAAEREALTLLGQGHTVKSAAARIGKSEHAVNERLREARRKTGAGSSRELARALAAQENRDRQIEVAAAPGGAAVLAAPGARGAAGTVPKGLPAVIMFSLAALAGAALIAPQQPPVVADDPAFDAAFPPATTNQLPELRARVRHETRDAAWGSAAETALAARYAGVAGLAEPVRVQCARTLCEVAGKIAAGAPEAFNATMQRLQDGDVGAPIPAAALTSDGISFGATGAKAPPVFVAYWLRAD